MNTKQRWEIRSATMSDINQIVTMVQLLVAELRGVSKIKLPSTSKDVVANVINGNIPGAIFIAEAMESEERYIGIITISVQNAIHVGGRYALIQELWVHPDYRNYKIGDQLIKAVESYCQEHDFNNIEVCLPKKEYEKFENTHYFYTKTGFIEIGPRMKKGV